MLQLYGVSDHMCCGLQLHLMARAQWAHCYEATSWLEIELALGISMER